ncbi:Uncharacterized protein TCM_012290 [Theobroma cacao]|uniref:Uncharacterized protein n=1 Tax=Theobroma cacao TaxID=3641 RepID=A0A061FU08_THECC|nr:Uncharacterized protein TCM_012290 [Theobroma cacao]
MYIYIYIYIYIYSVLKRERNLIFMHGVGTACGASGLLYGAIAFLIGMPCLLSCTHRTKLRNKLGLPEAPGPDWVTHFLCEW